jgi:hypothetical protein
MDKWNLANKDTCTVVRLQKKRKVSSMSNQVSCSLCDVLSHGGHRVAAAELSDSMPICKGCQSLSVDEIIKLASKSYNSNVSRWALSFQQAVASAVAQGSLFIHAHFVQDESDSQVQNGLSLHDRSCFTSKVTGLLDDAFCHPLAVDRVFMMDAAIPLRPPRVWTAATASERRVTRVLFAAFMNQISERHNIRLGVVCADGRSAMAVWTLDWLTAVDIIPAGRLVHSFHPMWPPYQKGHIGVAAGLLGPGLGSFSIGQFECESQGERGATTLLQGMVAFFNSLRLEGTMLGRVSSLALLQYEPAAMEAVAEISRVGVDPFFLLDMRSVVRGILTKTIAESLELGVLKGYLHIPATIINGQLTLLREAADQAHACKFALCGATSLNEMKVAAGSDSFDELLK